MSRVHFGQLEGQSAKSGAKQQIRPARPVGSSRCIAVLVNSTTARARDRCLYQAGRLKLDELITRRYSIDEAPQAFDDLAQGRNARGVIVFD